MNKMYILHYAEMDLEGSMGIDCLVFESVCEAVDKQKKIVDEFKKKYSNYRSQIIEEEVGTFKRVALADELAELQSHIVH